MVVHGINSAVEFFAATKDGKKLPLSVPTKIFLADIMQRMGYPNGNQSLVSPIDPTAFYDKAEGRYVITWGSAYYAPSIEGDGSPPLFVCVSADNQPLDTWTCWALSSITYAQPYARYCAGNPPSEYNPDYPQCESWLGGEGRVGWGRVGDPGVHVPHSPDIFLSSFCVELLALFPIESRKLVSRRMSPSPVYGRCAAPYNLDEFYGPI
jgi:hypothetical protein